MHCYNYIFINLVVYFQNIFEIIYFFYLGSMEILLLLGYKKLLLKIKFLYCIRVLYSIVGIVGIIDDICYMFDG